MPRDTCPVCDTPKATRFLRRAAVPVHQNLLLASARAARAIQRGDLDMHVCGECGFVFNAAFDPALLDYGPSYENSQEHSRAFSEHLDTLTRHLVEDCRVTSGRVVEVGCGKGAFLHRLLSHQESRCNGVGFDPSYLGPDELLSGRIRFVRDFYGPDSAVSADVVLCRHVIEHIPDPVDFLCNIRASLSEGARVFFETPCVRWILGRFVPWDFFYEHCSLFDPFSIQVAMLRAGFVSPEVRHVFGGQYLWTAASAGVAERLPVGVTTTRRLAVEYMTREGRMVSSWLALLDGLAGSGDVVVWGAGAKGVTFCNLTDPNCDRIAAVVDINPAKQGRFLAGTGHPIVAPQGSEARAVIVLNPNYFAEVTNALKALGSRASVIDLTHWENKACA